MFSPSFFNRFAFLAVVLTLVGAPALASSGGIGGFSGNPASGQGGAICNACHAGGITPTVTLTGPTSVPIGMVATYTLKIAGGQQIAGGLDVSATGGTLIASALQGTWLFGSDLTHLAPKNADGRGEVTWTFDWTAPMVPGAVTFYAAGNSVNLANGFNGDAGAGTTLDVTVTSGAVSTPGEASGSGLAQLTVTGFDRTTGELTLAYGVPCEATDHNVYYGDLAQVGSYGWSGETCAIGSSGAFNGFAPGSGSYFFVVVGTKASDEGSYGLAGGGAERPSFVGNACGQAQVLADRCD